MGSRLPLAPQGVSSHTELHSMSQKRSQRVERLLSGLVCSVHKHKDLGLDLSTHVRI